MGLFNFFKNKDIVLHHNPNEKKMYLDFENYLNTILDFFFRFKDEYLQIGDRISLLITADSEITKYSNTYFTCNDVLELQVFVSDWWDNIMVGNKDIGDQFENIFNIREGENRFNRRILIGSSTCCHLDLKEHRNRLYNFLDKYEEEHPSIKFDRSSVWGAYIKFGDWE